MPGRGASPERPGTAPVPACTAQRVHSGRNTSSKRNAVAVAVTHREGERQYVYTYYITSASKINLFKCQVYDHGLASGQRRSVPC